MKFGNQECKVEAIYLDNFSSEKMSTYAEAYCQIWREEPWCEDFWTKKVAIEDLRKMMSKDGSAGFVITASEKVVGFSLGYRVDVNGLKTISGTNELDFIFRSANKVFYIAELGIVSEYRGRGLSSVLTKVLISSQIAAGIEAFVLRTDIKASVARRVYVELGFEELSNVRDSVHNNRTYWLKKIKL